MCLEAPVRSKHMQPIKSPEPRTGHPRPTSPKTAAVPLCACAAIRKAGRGGPSLAGRKDAARIIVATALSAPIAAAATRPCAARARAPDSAARLRAPTGGMRLIQDLDTYKPESVAPTDGCRSLGRRVRLSSVNRGNSSDQAYLMSKCLTSQTRHARRTEIRDS